MSDVDYNKFVNEISGDSQPAVSHITIPSQTFLGEQDDEQYGVTIDVQKTEEKLPSAAGSVNPGERQRVSLLAMFFSKFLRVFKIIYNTETGAFFGKNVEEWTLSILTCLVAVGVVIIVTLLGVKLYYCHYTSKMLVSRIGAVQNEKMKLLKVVNAFQYKNDTYLDVDKNNDIYQE